MVTGGEWMIPFSSVVERTQFVDPGGQCTEQVIEHRVDPLMGTVASVNAALGEKAKAFLGAADVELLRDLEERSRAGCPFCHAGERGTRFMPEIAREGQLRRANADERARAGTSSATRDAHHHRGDLIDTK
jgi:hypothetical protein